MYRVDDVSEDAFTPQRSVVTPTVIFDFDGTVALGTGPVVAFARSLAEHTTEPSVVDDALQALAEFESGMSDDRDGYGSVTRVATAQGMSTADVSAAYMGSRAHLGTELAPVDLPAGLDVFLERLSTVADVWLATNAPEQGVERVLKSGDVHRSFTRIHFNVGKPDGLIPLLAEALEQGPVLSVGDIYDFDLAPAVTAGADTALVGVTAAGDALTVTMRAPTLQDLYPRIEAWVAAATLTPDASS